MGGSVLCVHSYVTKVDYEYVVIARFSNDALKVGYLFSAFGAVDTARLMHIFNGSDDE